MSTFDQKLVQDIIDFINEAQAKRDLREKIKMLNHGEDVEFTTTVTCRVLAPIEKGFPNTFRVPVGTMGQAYPDEFESLPGDVPVAVSYNDGRLIVSALEGHIAACTVETDVYGRPMKKIYKNHVVDLLGYIKR